MVFLVYFIFEFLIQNFHLLFFKGVQFQTINNCPHPIWVGFQGKSKSNPNYRVPFKGGWLQNPGQKRSFNVPSDLFASRIWARTNCATTNGRFRCETGDCGPWVECAHDGKSKIYLLFSSNTKYI